MRAICRAFPGVQALDRVDFTLRAGEIHALLGENGAGKSTLIKVLTGAVPRDGGAVYLDGTAIAPRSPREAQRLGIRAVYQEVNLVPYLSVAENIVLGCEPRRLGCIRWGLLRRRAREALDRLALPIDVAQPLNHYSVAIQQLVAIARALAVGLDDVRRGGQARVLVLDEPTSSLDAAEVARLFEVLRRLKKEGLGIVFITHFLEQVYQISDRLTVLRNGRLVGEFVTAALPREALVAHMIGHDAATVAALTERRAAAATVARRPLLRATRLGRRNAIQPLDLQIDAGEVVGLAGLLGSGRTETARLLFGLDRADSGNVEIGGSPVTLTSPRAAIRCGLGYCPEDRQTAGIVPDLSVRENIVLAIQARRGWWRPLARKLQLALVERYRAALRIATPDTETPVRQLSGGNQQKVILARWLAAEPRLLIVDEPTRGVDVGAKAEIERLIVGLWAGGTAILFISSELEEVVRNCHRVAVLRDRKKIGELSGAEVEPAAIVRLIAGPAGHG
jgi:simple sugar transport system ATP-binding protein